MIDGVPGRIGAADTGQRPLRWLALAGLWALCLGMAVVSGSVLGAVAYPDGRESIAKGALDQQGAVSPLRLVEATGAEIARIADEFRRLLRVDWSSACVVLAALVLISGPFLLAVPIVGPPVLVEGGRSMRAAVVGAAITAGAICTGLLGCIADLLWLATTSTGGISGWVVIGMLAAWLVMGTIFGIALARAGRERDPAHIARFARWLLAGTVIELALAAPTLAAAERRDNCSCSWGSFWALAIGLATLGALCGPALVLLATRDARRHWARAACMRCGYPRRTDTSTCSECGAALPPITIRAADAGAGAGAIEP